MLDNDLIKVFLPIVDTGLQALGFNNVAVVASAQPTQEGINTTPTVFFQKASAKRYGFPRSTYEWDEINSIEKYIFKYYLETEFQFRALSRADPEDTTVPTASDILDAVVSVLQNDTTVYNLKKNGVGILRITDEPTPVFVDDINRFEQAPYFSVVFTHFNTIVSTVSATDVVKPGIFRV